jgi:hypothetical protein
VRWFWRLHQRASAWYLRTRAGRAYHNRPYGPRGEYVVLMNERQYNRYTHLVRDEFA